MIYNLYTIYDSLAKECGPVFQSKNFDVGCRYVAEILKNNPVKLSEYFLCYVGRFDSDNGTIYPDKVERYCLDDLFGVDFEPKVTSVGVEDIVSDKELC